MAYTVLARKYRSQTFDEIVGQDAIAQTLKNAIKMGRVAHAYLFAGTRGVGKTTMARVLAKALNCLSFDGPTTEPCCKCESCVAVNIGEDIDVIEIDGATNNGVEQVRELRQNAIYRPARSRFKIYIIDEVHMLSIQAFNALLKTLEEPPSHVKFVFATTEPNKVIATIQSRCQRFDFGNISPAIIAEQLKQILEQEELKYEEDLLLQLAKMAKGSMRDGLSLLDRLISTGAEILNAGLLEEFLGCPNSEKIYRLVGTIGDSDAGATLIAAEELIASGLSETQIVDALTDCMRDLIVVKSTGTESELLIATAEQRHRLSELAEKFDAAGLVYNITALEKLRWSIKNSETARALLDALLLRFALSGHFLNVDELISRLKGASGTPIKKKDIAEAGYTAASTAQASKSTPNTHRDPAIVCDLHVIRESWEDFLRTTTDRLGASTSGLLRRAVPIRFEGGCLTLAFSAASNISKEVLERNGRQKEIQFLLSEHYSVPVSLAFEVLDKEQLDSQAHTDAPKRSNHNKSNLISDPAVKTVLIGLDATITGINEKP